MFPWDCCRLCLNLRSLNPIFPTSQDSDKYSNVIYLATGLKVEINDSLPQYMCSICINFINDCIKFRRKCEVAQKSLLNRLNNKQFISIKEENSDFKVEDETAAAIDISDGLSDIDNNFQDFDDNVTLDNFQFNNFISTNEKLDVEANNHVEFRTRVQEVEKPIIYNTKKKEKTKKKVRAKRAEKEKRNDKKNVREEIECEYCHKILTSKLSLRNHYKIHTGFDFVCEHCGKSFITKRLLLMHCRAKHGYEKTDKCSYCDYRASNAEQVKIHERLHTGERPYVCKECSAGFHRKSSYLQHIAIHLPEKTVQCDQCPARFKSVTLMRIHKNRHRAPRYTFKCRVCDNSFARRRNVARHLQRIHGLEADQQHIDRLKIG